MKKMNYLTCIILFALTMVACNNSTSVSPATADEVAAVDTPKGKYALKSGIVVYNTQMMGMDVKQTLYFDDYGAKEAQEVSMEMMGVKMHQVTISKDGFIYTLDMEQKTGTKVAAPTGLAQNIDFQNLSEEMAKDMELKKLGTEEFLGKTCDKMSIDYKKMSMKGTFLVYKGVALKSETDMGSMKMNLLAEKFDENPSIPSEKFEIPDDIKIMESK